MSVPWCKRTNGERKRNGGEPLERLLEAAVVRDGRERRKLLARLRMLPFPVLMPPVDAVAALADVLLRGHPLLDGEPPVEVRAPAAVGGVAE